MNKNHPSSILKYFQSTSNIETGWEINYPPTKKLGVNRTFGLFFFIPPNIHLEKIENMEGLQ